MPRITCISQTYSSILHHRSIVSPLYHHYYGPSLMTLEVIRWFIKRRWNQLIYIYIIVISDVNISMYIYNIIYIHWFISIYIYISLRNPTSTKEIWRLIFQSWSHYLKSPWIAHSYPIMVIIPIVYSLSHLYPINSPINIQYVGQIIMIH